LERGEELIDRDVIVVDDSLYSGKTFDCISMAARQCGARSVRALVAYDGSPEYRDDVTSLFRYHSEQPQPFSDLADSQPLNTTECSPGCVSLDLSRP
jgi:hypothetical protein